MRFFCFFFLILTFGCAKEDIQTNLVELEGGDTVEFRRSQGPCPRPQTFVFAEDSNWPETLFGEYGEEGSVGHWDLNLNCPAVQQPQGCEYPCDFITLQFPSDPENFPFVIYFDQYDPIYSDGIFSAAEQQAILDDIVAMALAAAPTCPDTPIQMEPIHYDVSWTVLTGGGSIYGLVEVTYAPPCRFVM